MYRRTGIPSIAFRPACCRLEASLAADIVIGRVSHVAVGSPCLDRLNACRSSTSGFLKIVFNSLLQRLGLQGIGGCQRAVPRECIMVYGSGLRGMAGDLLLSRQIPMSWFQIIRTNRCKISIHVINMQNLQFLSFRPEFSHSSLNPTKSIHHVPVGLRFQINTHWESQLRSGW